MTDVRRVFAMVLALSCAACGGGSETTAPAPTPAPAAAPAEAVDEWPAMLPTPTGLLGAAVDRRALLPEGSRDIPEALDPERAYGHVVALGPGDPTLRFLVWTARSPSGEWLLAGYALEVSENPRLQTITWETLDDHGDEADLRIRAERIEGTSLMERVVEGTLSARDGLFTPTN